MDLNQNKRDIQSALNKAAADASSGRESDRDTRRLGIYEDERRRHASAVEGNRLGALDALAAFLPKESPRIDRANEPDWLAADATVVGRSVELAGQPRQNRSAAARTQQPLEPVHSLMVGATKSDAGVSMPTDPVLSQYARALPLTPPSSWYDGSAPGLERANDAIRQAAGTVAQFQASWGAVAGSVETREGRGGDQDADEAGFRGTAAAERGSVDRPRLPRTVERDGASELGMFKALTRDKSFIESAIGSALGGFPETVGAGDRRPSAVNARTTIDPNRRSQQPASPSAGPSSSASRSGNESLEAAVEELERLRSAARRTADELEKVRGPVPPAFPARPPFFRDRS